MARESATMTGLIVWHDLIARDAVVARAFYAGLFGWELEGGILIEAGLPAGVLNVVCTTKASAVVSPWMASGIASRRMAGCPGARC